MFTNSLLHFSTPKTTVYFTGFLWKFRFSQRSFKLYKEFEDHWFAIRATRNILYGCVMSNRLIMTQPRNKWHSSQLANTAGIAHPDCGCVNFLTHVWQLPSHENTIEDLATSPYQIQQDLYGILEVDQSGLCVCVCVWHNLERLLLGERYTATGVNLPRQGPPLATCTNLRVKIPAN